MNTELVERVRERLVNTGSDITVDRVADAIRAETAGVVSDIDVLTALRALRQEFIGAGPLDPLLRDPAITDVLVTGHQQVWVDDSDGLHRTNIRFPNEESIRRLAQRLALAAGRRLDDAQPYVDAWLPAAKSVGQIRLHAILPPIATNGTCLSLRMLRPAKHSLTALRAGEVFSERTERLLHAIIRARLAFFVVGGTSSGKTTLLAALLGSIPATERVVCVEDVGELQPSHPQTVRLVARHHNVEGAGEITVRELLRQALRMRPDRIVVGEVRGAEVCELLAALNTGHDGGAGTIHANSCVEVPARIEALAALGGLNRAAAHSQLAAAVQVILHVVKRRDGQRKLVEIGVLERNSNQPTGECVVHQAWHNDRPATAWPALSQLLAARGEAVPC